jgi:metal-dependent amidase/aminoacylase/carboxypeptidase family protein
MSGLEYKSVNIINDYAQYASKGMNINLEGVPSHASEPEKGINPSYAVAEIIKKIPEFTLEENNEGNVLCTIIQVDVGKKAYGISASKGVLRLTIRAEIEKELDELQENLENFSSEVANNYGLNVEFTYNDIFPETYNHKESNDKIREVCQKKEFKFNEIKEAFRGSEDFGHYTKLTKGSICYIGNGEDYPNLHSYKYDFRDDLIEVAVELFKGLSEI